jgi:hypothetical protein
LLATISLHLLVPSNSWSAVIITARQNGNDVVLEGSGSFNLSALTEITGAATSSGSSIVADPPGVIVGGTNQVNVDVYGGFSLTAPSNFGNLSSGLFADSGANDRFGTGTAQILTSRVPLIIVPEAYTSGADVTGSAIFTETSFATMGITPGIYTWTWGTGIEFDSLTLHIIPEPGTLMLLLVAGGLLWRIQRA